MNESIIEKQVRLLLEKQCADIGREIGALLPAGVGFSLIVFDFGEGGNLAYVSNANRSDMIRSLEELLAKWKAER